MDIDIYQQCPCQSGKKIKFCCAKDVLGDLNEILAKNRSGQSAAALDQIDRVIAKMGKRNCLTTIQTHILISTGDIEKAKQVNDEFLVDNPGHATGLHHRALILLADGELEAAVEALQDAMDAITGSEIPISLGNAFRVVGMGLLSASRTYAAAAHLKYALVLKGDSDPELQRVMYELYRSPNTPLILKQDFYLAQPIEGVEWEKRYRNVHRALDRGQFRKALQFLEKIAETEPELPVVVRGLAIVNGFLGRNDEMLKNWRRYSQLDGIHMAEAVEAEAIAQIFDQTNEPEAIPLVRRSFEVSNTEMATEIAISNSRMVPMPGIQVDPFEEGPAPKAVFAVLDKDKLSSPDNLTNDTAPLVIGEILVYGKQTDREARFEIVSVDDGRADSISDLIKAEFSDAIASADFGDTKIGDTNELAELFEWNWHLPEGVTKQQHDELVNERRRDLLLNKWVNVKFPMLEGKTPVEAAADDKYQLTLQAMLLMIENAAQGQFFDEELTGDLRKKLGLKELGNLEYSDDKHVSSPLLQQRLEFSQLSNEALIRVRNEAMQIGNFRVLKRVLPEILNREDIDIPKDLTYSMLAHLVESDDEAFGYVEKAVESAKALDRPVGMYLVQEFEMRLARGLTEGLPQLLQTIQRDHLNDPEVEYRLVRVLDRYGIGPEQGPIRRPTEPQVAAASAGGGGQIWTPDQGEPPVAGSAAEPEGEEKESKLWIPD